MPKPKQFLKENKKKSKHATPVPTTADEFLEVGVDHEEAGEKWRGGDAAKSTRFFIRALDAYDEGLKKFPGSFDLAYNKARLQYEMTQHPKIRPQLPGTLLELLQTAIESSRYALKLDSDNADALFNTAQALCSYAEVSKNDELPSRYLEEALWLFELCLKNQLRAFDQDAAAAKTAAQGTNDVEMADDDIIPEPSRAEPSASASSVPASNNTQPQETAWARIVEPVTVDTILDTIIAQLETLAQLAKEVDVQSLSQLSRGSESPLKKTVRYLVDYYKDPILPALHLHAPLPTPRENDIKLAIANYNCAVADLQYNAEDIDLGKYEHAVFNAYDFDMSNNPEALCDAGESMVVFHAAVAHLGIQCEPYHTQRWVALGKAQQYFAAASKLSESQHKEKIYALRGDVEMLRFQLGRAGHGDAKKSTAVLLKNAKIFYNGAKKMADNDGVKDVAFDTYVKLCVIEAFAGDAAELKNAEEAHEEFKKVIAEAVSDGVVTSSQLADFGINGY
ncbi:hypothetical protein BDZ45DRAFT_677539 [Acephala macrosclerotiorum]|nr:hypothetical protein BDZ45DRAFT_677539 [Acephala macrosclerotiorum]